MKLFKSKKSASEKKAAKAADSSSPKEGKKKKAGLLGDGGLSDVLANHVEKGLLAVAFVLAILIIFSGFKKRQAIEGDQSPDNLQDQATRAVAVVNGGSWTDFQAERDREKHFLDRATETQKNVPVDAYSMGQLIKPPLVPGQTLRTDPKLLAPRDLQVISGYGALAIKTERGTVPDTVRGDGPRRDRDAVGWRDFVRSNGENTKGVYFVSVTALVPYREQLAEYEALKNTIGDDAERDQPYYLYWFLQRAEVNGAEPLQWKYVAKSFTAEKVAEKVWDGEGDEKRLDPPNRYTDELLTFKVPPLLLSDLPRYAFHNAIPRELPKPTTSEEKTAPTRDVESEDVLWRGLDESPRGGRNEEGREEADASKASREEGLGSQDAFEAGDRVANPPEYLMFRYFDLTVSPGKSYRYRLRLLLDDPNDPRPGGQFQAPPPDTLDQTVSERLHRKRTEKKGPPFGRFAPPSEPSPIVYVGNGNRLLAGKVKPADTVTLKDQSGSFARDEPTAQVMVMTFQPTDGANITAVKDFRRGSVGNFRAGVSYWPPAGEVAKSVEDHLFRTDLLLLDIRGGGPLADTGVEIPGQILIFNRDGRMDVINELNDAATFESNVVPEVEEEKKEDESRERERDNGPRGRRNQREGAGADILNENNNRRGRRATGR